MGLASRVVPNENLLDEAVKVGDKIGAYSRPVVAIAKECVNQAYEGGLKDGLLFERRSFHALFALDDQKEGMNAFIEQRDIEVQKEDQVNINKFSRLNLR